MNPDEVELQEPRAAEGPEMIRLVREGVVEALREHKSQGRSVIAWDREQGRVVELEPAEILIPEDARDSG